MNRLTDLHGIHSTFNVGMIDFFPKFKERHANSTHAIQRSFDLRKRKKIEENNEKKMKKKEKKID